MTVKQILFLMVLLCTFFSIKAQNRFQKIVSSSHTNTLYDMLVAADSSVVTIGYTNSKSLGAKREDLFVFRTDGNINRLSSFVIGDSLNERGRGVIQDKERNFVFAGTIHTDTNSWADLPYMWVMKTNERMDSVIFSKRVVFDTLVVPKSTTFGIKLLMDSSYLVFGEADEVMRPNGSHYYMGFLVKLNKSGNVLWSRTYGAYPYHINIHSVEEDASGNLYACGYSSEGGVSAMALFKLNASGNMIWDRSIVGPGGRKIKLSPDGYVYVTGFYEGGQTAGVILKMHPNGTLVWNRTYNSYLGFAPAFDFVFDKNNNLVVYTGGDNASGNPGAPYLWTISPSGKLLYSSYYPSLAMLEGLNDNRSLVTSPDAKSMYLLSSTYLNNGGWESSAMLARTDSTVTAYCTGSFTNTNYPSYQDSMPATPTGISIQANSVSVSTYGYTTTLRNCIPDVSVYCAYCEPLKPAFSFSFVDTSAVSFVNASDSVRALKQIWDFGDGYTSSTKNPTHTYSLPGMYMVKLKVFSDNMICVDSVHKTITVSGKPKAAFTSAGLHCQKSTITFSDVSSSTIGSVSSWSWQFGDGDTSTAKNTVHVYNNAGTYEVKLKVKTANGTTDSVSRLITVNPKPKSDFLFSGTCTADSVLFWSISTVSSGKIKTTEWGFGGNRFAVTATAKIAYATQGSYAVGLICTSDSNCRDTSTRTVVISDKQPISLSARSACVYDSVLLWNTSGPYDTTTSVYWDTNDDGVVDFTGFDSVWVKPGSAGNYSARFKVSRKGCADSAYVNYDVYRQPDKPLISRNGDSLLSSALHGNSWFRNGISTNDTGRVLIPATNGQYSVVAVNEYGCASDSADEYAFFFSGLMPIQHIAPVIKIVPNPNGGSFTLETEATHYGEQCRIYDLYGRIILELPVYGPTTQISFESFTNGIYYITVGDSGSRLVIRK